MYYKLIVILSSIFLLVGCGSSSKPIESDEINNSGKARNDIGYYGKGVYFAGMPVVGFWDDFKTGWESYQVLKLNDDGRVEVYNKDAIKAEYTYKTQIYKYKYGVNEAGTRLELYYGSASIPTTTGTLYIYSPTHLVIEYLDINDWDAEWCVKTLLNRTESAHSSYPPREFPPDDPYIFCRTDELNVTYIEEKYWWLKY